MENFSYEAPKNDNANGEESLEKLDLSYLEENPESLLAPKLKQWADKNNISLGINVEHDPAGRPSFTFNNLSALAQEDRKILMVRLESNPDCKMIIITDYDDNPVIRGQHITGDFLDNLENLARKMGYRVLAGDHHEDCIGYFISKRNGYPVDNVGITDKSLEVDDFTKNLNENAKTHRALIGVEYHIRVYKFLYEEDEKTFVDDYYRNSKTWQETVKYSLFPQNYDLEGLI